MRFLNARPSQDKSWFFFLLCTGLKQKNISFLSSSGLGDWAPRPDCGSQRNGNYQLCGRRQSKTHNILEEISRWYIYEIFPLNFYTHCVNTIKHTKQTGKLRRKLNRPKDVDLGRKIENTWWQPLFSHYIFLHKGEYYGAHFCNWCF